MRINRNESAAPVNRVARPVQVGHGRSATTPYLSEDTLNGLALPDWIAPNTSYCDGKVALSGCEALETSKSPELVMNKLRVAG